MGFQEVIEKLNDIKKIGLIQDYAIGGAYAVTVYDLPQATYDLDVLVIVSSENDFTCLSVIFEYFGKNGQASKDEHILIGDMPVQFFPNCISPLYDNAIEEARAIEFDGISTKFVSIEHLILLLLTSFRPKDKIRIGRLLTKANNDIVLSLIKRFDDEKKTLYERYGTILGQSD